MKSVFFKGVIENTRKNFFMFDSVQAANIKCLASVDSAMKALQNRINSKKMGIIDTTINTNVDRVKEIIDLANANVRAADLATDFSNMLTAQINSYTAGYALLSKDNNIIDDYNYFYLIMNNYLISSTNQKRGVYNTQVDALNNLINQLKQKISELNGKNKQTKF